MADKFDPTNPAHFALMYETDAKLLTRGYTQAQIDEMRAVQQKLPPVTSADELADAPKAQPRTWGDSPAPAAQKSAAAPKPAEAK